MRLKKQQAVDNPIQIKPEKKERPRLRKVLAWLTCLVLLLFIGIMIFASIFPQNQLLQVPGAVVADTVTPVQNIFSSITNAVVDYLRMMKLRSNLEYEYNLLKSENEQLVYKAMLAEELQNKLAAYENFNDEIAANAAMNPIMCAVIGSETSNYFSVFTINKGANDGIEDLMAVTMSGALVGYTYDVTANRSKVRAIIDSQASIAGLIQSSRDHGMVRGTLGIDGQPMCRMYYLPNSLPRPGDTVVTSGVSVAFPKGIPIGTVRESTRGMDANKQYIVVEPLVDFEHIEYVIVLRYKPYAEDVETQGNTSVVTSFVLPDTPRPVPDLQVGDTIYSFGSPTPTVDPDATPGPSGEMPSPPPSETQEAPSDGLEYQVPGGPSTGSATEPPEEPTATPSPDPTFSPDELTIEGD